MRYNRAALIATLGMAALSMAPFTASATPIVVDFRDGISDSSVQDIARSVGVRLRPNSDEMVGSDGIYIGDVDETRFADVVSRLQQNGNVQFVEENVEVHALGFTPNDERFPEQWGLTRSGIQTSAQFTCGRGAVIAVIDTGVACRERDGLTGLSDLAETRCIRGWNFVADNDNTNDDQGHGSHCAGTIAQSTNNRIGGAGLAFCSTILPVKVLNSRGSGTLADVAEGIRWAADHGANVISMSLGSDTQTTSPVEADAVRYAHQRGVAVIVAAGNNGEFVGSPANAPYSFAISAIDDTDTIARFSSRGPQVDLAAPGVNILQQTVCENGRNGCEQYAAFNGTSMATPHAAAAAGLIYSLGVTDPTVVETILQQSASVPSHGSLNPSFYGAGILDAAKAVRTTIYHNAWIRLLLTAMLGVLLTYYIKMQKGKPTFTWIPAAIIAGVGLPFIPELIGVTQLPGFVDLAIRPFAEWDMLVTGASWHNWLPMANVLPSLLLVGIGGLNHRLSRAVIGGVSVGTLAYLLATVLNPVTVFPLGTVMQWVWVAANGLGLAWFARISTDSETLKK